MRYRSATSFTNVFLLLAIAARFASTPTANLSFLMVAGYAMLGRAQAIKALMLSWLFSMLSPGLAAEATSSSIGRYAVLLAAACSVSIRSGWLRGNLVAKPITLATLMIGLLIVVHALMFSPYVDVSILKAVSWTVATTTLISAWSGLSWQDREKLEQQVFGGLTVILILSLPLLAHPLGYLRNASGFQGILSHPQVFGPTMALLGSWAASRLLAELRPSWFSIGLFGSCILMVVLSEARTAGVAMLLGVTIAVVAAPALSGRTINAVLPGLRSKRIYFVLALTALALVLASSQVGKLLSRYIEKRGDSDTSSLIGAYQGSRGELIEKMWANIELRPLQGIGFGVASDPYNMTVTRDPVLGLPTSAVTEKGVLPLAVWEELGLLGLIAVVVWLLMLMMRGARGGVAPVAVGLTALLLNMGESVLFSPGGLGLLILILLGWAYACGLQKQGGSK